VAILNRVLVLISLLNSASFAQPNEVIYPRLERHYPIYFISGEPDTKIQMSFKVGLIERIPLYLGYSQIMFWQTDKTSIPFKDINFNPELFYRTKVDEGILKQIDFGLLEHRSNGKDGLDSRSWNRSYVNATSEFKWIGLDLRWDAKVFYLWGIGDETRSVRNTLGWLDTALTARNVFKKAFKDADIQFRVLPGGKLDLKDPQGYQEFNFRFKIPWERFNPFIFIQVYNGLNETMLDYKDKRTSYRVGVAF
jgi:phospholipase A1/A2